MRLCNAGDFEFSDIYVGSVFFVSCSRNGRGEKKLLMDRAGICFFGTLFLLQVPSVFCSGGGESDFPVPDLQKEERTPVYRKACALRWRLLRSYGNTISGGVISEWF